MGGGEVVFRARLRAGSTGARSPHPHAAPRTWAVEAVGMGASSSELRMPWVAMRARRPAQSRRSDSGTPHMSGWRMPRDTGEPGYVS